MWAAGSGENGCISGTGGIAVFAWFYAALAAGLFLWAAAPARRKEVPVTPEPKPLKDRPPGLEVLFHKPPLPLVAVERLAEQDYSVRIEHPLHGHLEGRGDCANCAARSLVWQVARRQSIRVRQRADRFHLLVSGDTPCT